MPSTAAKAMILSPKVAVVEPIHFNAHSAFFFTQGTEKVDSKRKDFCVQVHQLPHFEKFCMQPLNAVCKEVYLVV